MKASILIAFTLISLSSNAQNDSTFNKKQDTIKIGNMVIVGDNSVIEGNNSTRRRNERRNTRELGYK